MLSAPTLPRESGSCPRESHSKGGLRGKLGYVPEISGGIFGQDIEGSIISLSRKIYLTMSG